MYMIEILALENGAHRNQTFNGLLPDGWAKIPDDMELPDTFPFVDVVAEGEWVVSMTAGVMPEPVELAPVEPKLTEEDDTAAMLVDHEYRLTLLELGLFE